MKSKNVSYLGYIPKIGLDFSGLINLNTNTHYVISHLIDFRYIVKSIQDAHKFQEDTTKLGIRMDPWDNYLYHDSKLFWDFIFNKTFYTTNERFVFLKFLIFVYYNDFMSNFKVDGKLLADKLSQFLNNQDTKIIGKFVDKVLVRKIEPTEEEMNEFENNIEVKFDLFLQKLAEDKLFSDKKNDYFNA
jgi:hypothetical protein